MAIEGMRLQTGEEVLGTFTKQDDEYITVRKPAVVQVVPDGQGSARMGLAPYAPFAQGETISIPKRYVMFTYDPIKTLQDSYMQAFSGIVPASAVPPVDFLKK